MGLEVHHNRDSCQKSAGSRSVSQHQPPMVQSEPGGRDDAYEHLSPAEKRETPKEVREARIWRGHILFFFAVILAGALAWQLRSVLELVYVSALFAVVLMPIVQHIQKVRIRRWSPSRPLAIVVLVLGVLTALVLFFILCLPPVLRDIHHFVEVLPIRSCRSWSAKIRHRLPMSDKLGLDFSCAAKTQGMVQHQQRRMCSHPCRCGWRTSLTS